MIAKGKAKQLVNKFNIDLSPFSQYGHWDIEHAKKCALICVDEIQELIEKQAYGVNYLFERDYWQEVKEEIELL